jgi:hypothetical protein
MLLSLCVVFITYFAILSEQNTTTFEITADSYKPAHDVGGKETEQDIARGLSKYLCKRWFSEQKKCKDNMKIIHRRNKFQSQTLLD